METNGHPGGAVSRGRSCDSHAPRAAQTPFCPPLCAQPRSGKVALGEGTPRTPWVHPRPSSSLRPTHPPNCPPWPAPRQCRSATCRQTPPRPTRAASCCAPSTAPLRFTARAPSPRRCAPLPPAAPSSDTPRARCARLRLAKGWGRGRVSSGARKVQSRARTPAPYLLTPSRPSPPAGGHARDPPARPRASLLARPPPLRRPPRPPRHPQAQD